MSNKIQRQTLVDALALLKPGLSSKDIIESGQSFSFHQDCIVTFNGLISVMAPLETGIEGAIRAEEFYKILDKIQGEELTIARNDNEIRISSGKVKAGLKISDKLIAPLNPQADLVALPKQFKEAINFCQFSASRNMTKPHLTCLHIQDRFVTGADDYRITEMWMDEASPRDFLLPADAVQHLVRYNFTHLALDQSWAHFFDEESGVVFSCLLKAGKLIDVSKHFDIEGTQVTLPDQLKESLDRIKIMVEGDTILDLKIKLQLETGKLICRAEKAVGWIEEVLDIDYQGEPVTMLINPLFLADILGRTKQMMVNDQVCMFWGENFRHVMMLVAQ